MYNPKTDYAKLMEDAYAKGDAKAFNAALNARQEKIDAQGLSGKVESNQDILNRLNSGKTNQTAVAPVVTPTAIAPTATAPMVPQYDIMAEIERAKNARYASRQSALEQLRNKTNSSLKAESATIKPMYYDKRNEESSSSQLRAKKLAELMAAKGYSEGANAQSMITNNATTQGNLGLLNRQEQAANDDITRRMSDAEIAYQEGLAQAKADAETTAAEQALSELGIQRDYSRQDAETAKSDARYTDELNYSRSQQEKKDFENSLTTSTYPDIQAEIDNIINDNDTSNDWKIPILKNLRAQKIDEQTNATATQNKIDYDRAWDKWLKNAPLSAKEYQILGITPGTKYAPSKSLSSGGGSTPSVSQQNADAKANAQTLTGSVQTYLDQWASGKAEDRQGQRADQTDMINYLKANAGVLTQQGVDVNALVKWVTENYTWVR